MGRRVIGWLLCRFGRHAWQVAMAVSGRHYVNLCVRCHAPQRGPDGQPVIFYVPTPKRATRRDVARKVTKRVKRRVKDDALMASADRDLADLEKVMG